MKRQGRQTHSFWLCDSPSPILSCFICQMSSFVTLRFCHLMNFHYEQWKGKVGRGSGEKSTGWVGTRAPLVSSLSIFLSRLDSIIWPDSLKDLITCDACVPTGLSQPLPSPSPPSTRMMLAWWLVTSGARWSRLGAFNRAGFPLCAAPESLPCYTPRHGQVPEVAACTPPSPLAVSRLGLEVGSSMCRAL